MLVTGVPPWMADDEPTLAKRVQNDELIFPGAWSKTLSPHLRNLITRLLVKDPSMRPNLTDTMEHEWVTEEVHLLCIPRFLSLFSSGKQKNLLGFFCNAKREPSPFRDSQSLNHNCFVLIPNLSILYPPKKRAMPSRLSSPAATRPLCIYAKKYPLLSLVRRGLYAWPAQHLLQLLMMTALTLTWRRYALLLRFCLLQINRV